MFSNNELSHALYHENKGLLGRLEPILNDDVRADVMRMGEPAFNQHRTRRAVSWIRQHPEEVPGTYCSEICTFLVSPVWCALRKPC